MRAVALGTGIVVAAVSFTLLTSAVETGQLRVVGTIAESFRPAYDILVRPEASFTGLEQGRNLVQNNYLSGIYGGITFEDYRSIQRIPGVEVAAPIANIGWILPFQEIPVSISRFLSEDPVQMYRLRFDWLANNRLSRYPDATRFVYYTRRNRFVRIPNGLSAEVLPSGEKVTACWPFVASKERTLLTDSPFSIAADTAMSCFSERTPRLQWPVYDQGPFAQGGVGVWAFVFYPMLVTAIDPEQELRLIDLADAVVDGRMLSGTDEVIRERGAGSLTFRSVPILVSERTYLDETLQVTVERLQLPPEPRLHDLLGSEERAYPFVRRLRGEEIARIEIPAQEVYDTYLRRLAVQEANIRISYSGYWTSSPIGYEMGASDRLIPAESRNPPAVFQTEYGAGWAPLDNRDTQYRRLVHHAGSTTASDTFLPPSFRVVGRFDPERLPGFSPLSQVPLETYYPPGVTPASRESRQALGGRPLLPTMNLGGYVSQPPLMLTNLEGLRAFVDADRFEGAHESAPISVIRVRVEGVTGPDPLSRERIRRVAELIHSRTGLTVDVTAGSSPRPIVVDLPAGRFGQPDLLVREGWVEKGVAVRFLQALDEKSLTLFLLVLVVTAFFLANGALASVRSRRVEIGTLSCLGWSRSKIFLAIIGELSLVGLVAGIVGTAIAALLVRSLSLDISSARTLLVVPTAMLLAAIAGIVPAWRASLGAPLDAVRPPVTSQVKLGVIRSLVSMALANLLRLPGRALVGSLGLFVGVGALTFLLSVNLAFHGVLVGTLLGNAISIEVRAVDVLSVVLATCLAGLSVADVIILNVHDRAAELVTLRASGWPERQISTVIALEGVAIGILGVVPGALAGMALAASLGGFQAGLVWAATAAALSGIGIALVASIAPSALVSRMTPPSVLAME